MARPSCLELFRHLVRRDDSRAICTAGKSNATSTPMIAITTNSSTSVNPDFGEFVTRVLPEGGKKGGLAGLESAGQLTVKKARTDCGPLFQPPERDDEPSADGGSQSFFRRLRRLSLVVACSCASNQRKEINETNPEPNHRSRIRSKCVCRPVRGGRADIERRPGRRNAEARVVGRKLERQRLDADGAARP